MTIMITEMKPAADIKTPIFVSALIYIDGSGAVPCVVRDMTPIEAKLQLSLCCSVPDNFILLIDNNGRKLVCRVKNRDGTKIGVLFS
jgi:hypothetical protein